MKQIKKSPQQMLDEKKRTLYGVKAFNAGNKADVSTSNRTVSFVGNTYYYADAYLDVLVSGAAKKTIADNGPTSTAEEKINHIADHKLDTDHLIGRFTKLEEGTYEHQKYGELKGIISDSFIPETQKGDEYLMNYVNEMYNQHSIGFMYRDLILADKESVNQSDRMMFEEYYPQVINKEVIDKYGFFFVVKEIELWEISTVMRGANKLTTTLGIKSDDSNTALIELYNRLEILGGMYKSSSSKKNIELQMRQIKQIMSEIVNDKSQIKVTEKPTEDSILTTDDIKNWFK